MTILLKLELFSAQLNHTPNRKMSPINLQDRQTVGGEELEGHCLFVAGD